MSGLFIELYLDEDVSILVAALLQGRGYSVLTAHSEGKLGQSDAEQMAHAVSLGRTLLTHNRADFEMLAQGYAEMGQNHNGVILARRYSPYELVRRLIRVLDHVTADEMQNQVRYI